MRLLLSSAALLIGFLLDAIIGDPPGMPHIIRAIGKLISWLDGRLPRTVGGGVWLVVIVLGLSTGISAGILYLGYRINIWLGFCLESLLCFQLLAAKSLKKESTKVYTALRDGTVQEAREAVSMIVGRDTEGLTADGITRAAVETVAENASDGVIAPLLFMAVGGGILGVACKAVNTMDSMVGYKNDKYRDFGRAAAKLDDAMNYIPSRLGALTMILASFIAGFDGKNAFKIWRRDRRRHKSPNSAQTEAVCAGALGITLAGPAVYFGKTHSRPYIGDAKRAIEPEDILRANRLMYVTGILFLILCLICKAPFIIVKGL